MVLPNKETSLIRVLFESLGYSLSYKSDLHESIRTWRKTYICKDGTNSRELLDWRLQATQDNLQRMANDFLEYYDYGERFWPAKERTLQYPEDKIE